MGCVAGDFGIRHARWRAWLRVRTPDFLYFRADLVVPKAKDCVDHEWSNGGEGMDECYHCKVRQHHAGPPWPMPPARTSRNVGSAGR
jgi:hypothetical protein